jgi:hypothetical protein
MGGDAQVTADDIDKQRIALGGPDQAAWLTAHKDACNPGEDQPKRRCGMPFGIATARSPKQDGLGQSPVDWNGGRRQGRPSDHHTATEEEGREEA